MQRMQYVSSVKSAAVNTWRRDGSCSLLCVERGAKAARTFEKVLDDFVGVVLPIKQHCHQLFVASLELNKTQRRRREKAQRGTYPVLRDHVTDLLQSLALILCHVRASLVTSVVSTPSLAIALVVTRLPLCSRVGLSTSHGPSLFHELGKGVCFKNADSHSFRLLTSLGATHKCLIRPLLMGTKLLTETWPGHEFRCPAKL